MTLPPKPWISALGVSSGIAVALLLKACAPLASSVDKSRPANPFGDPTQTQAMDLPNPRFSTVFFRDQTPQIAIPSLFAYRRVILPEDALDTLKREGRLQGSSRDPLRPESVVALFKLSLSDSEIAGLKLSNLQPTLQVTDAPGVPGQQNWTVEIPVELPEQESLWKVVRAHLTDLHLAVIFREDAPELDIQWSTNSFLVPETSGDPEAIPTPAPSP
jgi:hypothetical protein